MLLNQNNEGQDLHHCQLFFFRNSEIIFTLQVQQSDTISFWLVIPSTSLTCTEVAEPLAYFCVTCF